MTDDAAEMTSSAKLTRALEIATKASAGIIAVRCPPTEVFRVVETIQLASLANNSRFRLWTQIMGWGHYDSQDTNDLLANTVLESDTGFNPIKPSNVTRMLMYAQAIEQMPSRRDDDLSTGEPPNPDFPDDCFYVMLDVHFSFGEPGFQAYIRRQAQRSYELEQRLFIVMPDSAEIPDEIAPFLHIIDYEYPGQEELLQLLRLMVEAIEDENEQPDLSEDEYTQVSILGLGMTKTAFENAVALSFTDWFQDHSVEDGDDPPTFEHICKWVRNYKMEVLRKTEVLEMQEAVPIDEIGGLDNYKDWMNVRRSTYKVDAIARGITPSRGVLVVGVPGSGKSLIAKAAGSQLELPVVRFDIGRVFGSFIGQSEQRMRGVLKQLDAMAPCVLMVDEIDKGFSGTGSGGGNDSGTSMRVFGTFLTWLQERNQRKRPIFCVFTANRVTGLPPELMRPGRIDEKFAVNAPNADEREAILVIHARKRKIKILETDMPVLVEMTNRMVGAEIESLVEQCLIHAFTDDSDTLSVERFAEERKHLRLMADSFADNINAIVEWTSKHARPASAEPGTLVAARRQSAAGVKSIKRRPIIKKSSMH